MSTKGTCANCGTTLVGTYCHACGEKKLQPKDFRIGHFLQHLLEGVTNLNSNFFRTFRLLFTRPGALANAYMNGRRKAYLKPIQVFLICNIFYFMLASTGLVRTFNTPLQSQINSGNFWHKDIARAMVEAEINKRDIKYADYQKLFNRVTDTQSKTLLIIMVPLFAILLYPLLGKKRGYFVGALVFSLHFYAKLLSLVILLVMPLGPIIKLLQSWVGTHFINTEDALTLWAALILIVLLYIGLRRAFSQGKIAALTKSIVLTFGVYYILLAYRALLFFVTFYTV